MWGINSLNTFGWSKETSANFSMRKEDFKYPSLPVLLVFSVVSFSAPCGLTGIT